MTLEDVMNTIPSGRSETGGGLRPEERQVCEVWTRVMGYHRPVASFNEGKKGEHYERTFFVEARLSA